MRRMVCFALAAVLVGLSPSTYGQDPKADVQEKLNALFVLTKTTADNSDIVTPGSILVLHKDGLVLFSVDSRVPPTITYKDGRLSMGFGATLAADIALGAVQEGENSRNVPQRKFVAGEKFWIIASTVKDDGVYLEVYSDPYQDVRYFGQLKFPFNRKSAPSADDVLKTIAEVVSVEPAESNSQPPAPAASPAPTPSAFAPIAPPPPPSDAPPPPPKKISLGQTRDQVIATFGQPQKVVDLGTKEIDYYTDMKVTFIKGKVTDVQ